MSIHVLVEKYYDMIEGRVPKEDLEEYDQPLTEYASEAMRSGGKKLSRILRSDKTMLYYTIAGVVAGLVIGDEATDEDVELITRITPAMVNLVVGIADELGLNENAQYTIVLGKEKQDE